MDKSEITKDIRIITANVAFILDGNLQSDSIRHILEEQETALSILYRCARFPPFFAQLPTKTKMGFLNSWLVPIFAETRIEKEVKYRNLSQFQEKLTTF